MFESGNVTIFFIFFNNCACLKLRKSGCVRIKWAALIIMSDMSYYLKQLFRSEYSYACRCRVPCVEVPDTQNFCSWWTLPFADLNILGKLASCSAYGYVENKMPGRHRDTNSLNFWRSLEGNSASCRSRDSSLTVNSTDISKPPTGSSQLHIRGLLSAVNKGEFISPSPHIWQGVAKSKSKVDGITLGF